MEGSGEGSEEANEGEKDGRGVPFCVRGDTTRHGTGGRAGGCDNGRKSQVVKRPSRSHATPAWRL
jgi:hypothetical protein